MVAVAEARAARYRGATGGLRAEHWAAGAVAVVLLALIVPPILVLLRNSVVIGERIGRTGTLSLDAYAEILTSHELPALVGSTIAFALGSTIVGLILGGGLAWCAERTDAPFKQLAYAGIVVSFAVPGILRTIGWIFLLGPRTGAVNELFRAVTGSDGVLFDVFSFPAMVFVEGVFWIPLTFLLMSASFRAMDPSLEEAAAVSGANPAQALRRITVGLAVPSVLAIVILTFIRGVQAFEVPLLLGVPAKIRVLTTEVYFSVHGKIVPEYSYASAYGVLMVGFLAACIWLYARATRNALRYATITGKGYRPRALPLGRWRWLAGAFIVGVVALQFLPVIYLAFASFLPTFGLAGPVWEHLTLRNYERVLRNPDVLTSLRNSAVIGVSSATLVVVVGAVAAWVIIRARLRWRGLLDQLASLPLVFPGVVLGIAVLGLYIRSPIPVYGTIWIFVIAYVTSYIPFGLRYVHPGLLRIHPELEESAALSGARWGAVFVRIVVPLLLPALVAAWMFVFLISIRELSVAALLWTSRSTVIATTMLDLWQNGNVNQVSAFGTIVAALGVTFAIAAYRLGRRFGIQG